MIFFYSLMEQINNINLYTKRYDESVLINNIDNLSRHSILITQKNLSNKFIEKYIINSDIVLFREDDNITYNDIIKYQPLYRLTKGA